MSTVLRVGAKGQGQFVSRRQAGPLAEDLGTEVALIQALIPLGLEAVHDVLRREVEELAGARYARSGGRPGHVRWSKERGSVYLSDQKLPIVYQRVRDQPRDVEVPLETYQRFQQPRALDAGLLRRVLLGLSCRRYAECAEAVPEAFGLAPSTVSRRYIRVSARQLQALSERRLDGYDLVALLLDGKTFAEDEMVIALGVTLQGQQVILGFVQTATENTRVAAEFFRPASRRPGAARCSERTSSRRTPRRRRRWTGWHASCARSMRAPVRSLAEGLEETLTLHRLGVAGELGRTFKTTNALESVMAQVEQRTGKVDRWRSSDQKQDGWRVRCWTSNRGSVGSAGTVHFRNFVTRYNACSERRCPRRKDAGVASRILHELRY
jgi:putative transposase